jgi:hypothetical protein
MKEKKESCRRQEEFASQTGAGELSGGVNSCIHGERKEGEIRREEEVSK